MHFDTVTFELVVIVDGFPLPWICSQSNQSRQATNGIIAKLDNSLDLGHVGPQERLYWHCIMLSWEFYKC
jgi:hypothetical protein